MDLDLDDLLEESVVLKNATKKEKEKAKPDKTTSTAWLTGKEREQMLADNHRPKHSAEDWLVVGVTLMFTRQVCFCCGWFHTYTEGVFLKKEHKRLKATQFLRAVNKVDYEKLPRTTEVKDMPTEICPACYRGDGEDWPEVSTPIIRID